MEGRIFHQNLPFGTQNKWKFRVSDLSPDRVFIKSFENDMT